VTCDFKLLPVTCQQHERPWVSAAVREMVVGLIPALVTCLGEPGNRAAWALVGDRSCVPHRLLILPPVLI
jgi:hypothetical protein